MTKRVSTVVGWLAMVMAVGGCAAGSQQQQPVAAVEVSTAVPADIQQAGLDVANAFDAWMREHSVSAGAVAVSHRGETVLQHGYGRDVTAAFPIASLSKVITATCLYQLLDDRRMSVLMSLGDAAPRLLAEHPPADARLATVTLAQLIGHNSGIHSRYHRDYIASSQVFTRTDMSRQFASLAAETMAAAPGSGYHYSNANYLLLGLAIEEISGQPYERYCDEQLLRPAGAKAQLSTRWRVMSSWGGWQISAPDFLKFLNRYFADNKVLGRAPSALGVNAPLRRGAFYNLGTMTREANGGHRFWHAGSWRWRGQGRDDQFGAYFVTREDGLMVALNYAAHAQGDKLRDLESRLVRAMKL